MYRIGYACKYKHTNTSGMTNKDIQELEKSFNTRSTTAKWCRDNPAACGERIYDIVIHNIQSIKKQLEYVSSLPEQQRMLRISSDILPLYTHSDFSHIYDDQDFRSRIERGLAECGEYARQKNIRVSFHPGQFTVLASENPCVVEKSIEEFEYHVYMLVAMGYCKTFQDAKCNVHVGGKLGINGILKNYGRLSPEARCVITIENDEISYGLDEVLLLGKTIPIVLDIHHHFIKTGEYITRSDDRVKRVIASWQGVRPTMHYSLSREDVIIGHSEYESPDLANLLKNGYNKQKLRAHSEMMWNHTCNLWAATFLDSFDIMIEAKQKNLASTAFYHSIRGHI